MYDIISLSECLEEFTNTFYEKYHGRASTAASMSFDAFRNYLCKLENIDNPKLEDKEEVFRHIYPLISQEHLLLSTATYSGGICTISENHAGKILHNLNMLDLNSSYPKSMTINLPYGHGKQINDFCYNDDFYKEYIIYIEFNMKGQPFQRCNSESRARVLLNLEPPETIYTRSQFPKHFDGYLCINSIDLSTLLKYADIEQIEFKKGVSYKTNTIIRDFILPVYEMKRTEKGVQKLAAKLLLNALYGKFAQDLSGVVQCYDDLENSYNVIAIDKNPIYKPLASAITANSRKMWVELVYILGKDFIYGDTDSAYFLHPEKNMRKLFKLDYLHDDELGKWSTDYSLIQRGKFLSKKNYLIEYNGKMKLTCVGLSEKYHSQINFDNFELNSQLFETWKMTNIYGGKAMRKFPFKIHERGLF